MILGFALITSLIDRRLSIQHRLLESERKMLRALIDHIPESMYVKDTEGRFLLANIQVARTHGFDDPQQMIGKSDYKLERRLHEDEQRVMHSGRPLFNQEETAFDAAGNRMHMCSQPRCRCATARARSRELRASRLDISERKKNEEALREAEQKYRAIFNGSFAGLFELGADGCVLNVNPAMAELLGYETPEEVPATMTEPLWTRAVLPERGAEFAAKMKVAGYVRHFEMEVIRNDGSKIWVSSSARAKWQGRALIGYAGMFEDITERKLLREQLLQAQKLESVGQLAAGIAHEINTPVQYIGDNVRFLQDSFSELMTLNAGYGRLLAAVHSAEVTPQLLEEISLVVEKVDVDYLVEEIPKAIEQTLEGVSHVSALVGAMKEFSHPGTGEKVPLDLNRAIESTITVARNEWKYVADMQVELDPTLPQVTCFPGGFNQVILNLIVNAAHAIEDVAARGGQKGLITIRTRSLPTAVEVQIQDNGARDSGEGTPAYLRSFLHHQRNR